MKPQPTHNQTDTTFWTREKFIILALFWTLGSVGLLHVYLVKSKRYGIVAAVGNLLPGTLPTPPVTKALPTLTTSHAYWHTISTQNPWAVPATQAVSPPMGPIGAQSAWEKEVTRAYIRELVITQLLSLWKESTHYKANLGYVEYLGFIGKAAKAA